MHDETLEGITLKTRVSGMPDEALRNSFFQPEEALAALKPDPTTDLAVEFGCGYGTFNLNNCIF